MGLARKCTPRRGQVGWRPALAVAAFAGLLGAYPAPGQDKATQQYVRLEAEISTTSPSKQAQLLAKLAEMDYSAADKVYDSGDAESGERQLARARDHADQALAILQSEASQGKKDGMKEVEQSLQRISSGLQNLTMNVRVASRPNVKAAAEYFSGLREKVLQLLFAPKPKNAG